MSHFLHILDIAWEPALVIGAALLAFWLGRRFGKRWHDRYKDALANRQEWLQLKADAQLRAAQQVGVHVNVNPNINVGPGQIVSFDQEHREETSNDYRSAFCPFCGRFGCRSDCREALSDGPSDLPDLYEQLSNASAPRLVPPVATRIFRNRHPSRLLPMGGEGPDTTHLADDDRFYDEDDDL